MIERNSEIRQGVVAAILSAAALAGSIYCGKAWDYRNVFIPGTVINGVDAAEHTVEEMEDLLGEYKLNIAFRDGEPVSIPAEDIEYHYVPDGNLDRLMKEQNPLLWLYGMYNRKEFGIPEEKVYNEDKLVSILTGLPQMQEHNMINPEDAYLDYRDGKFMVIPEVEGTKLDPGKVVETVKQSIGEEKEEVLLDKTDGIYSAPEIRSDDEELNRDEEQLNDLAGARIEYEMPDGSRKVLDGPILRDWLEVDDDGNYYRDDDLWDECIADFGKELAEEADTVYKEHPFTTHYGDEIMLPGKGYYGYKVEQSEERDQLWDELDENEQLSREPVYRRTEAAGPDDNNGFGGDYVEVDLSVQHLWIYNDGEVVFETDVVSGLNDSEHRTPSGAFFAYDKKRDTVLRGDKQDDGEWGYETPVSYWIRLTDTGIGLHDASWRGSFGGSIWRWSGSHGCINCPTWAMPTIYDLVYPDMPVAVHYGE